MDCKLDKIFYGNFLAVRDSHVPIEKEQDHWLHRSFRLRQKYRVA